MEGLIDSLRQLIDVRGLIAWGGIIGITGIIFVETGLFFGFFLPGDSLLVTAGILAAAGQLDLRWLIIFPTIAAIVGDQTGDTSVDKPVQRFREKYPKFKDHLDRAHAFYEKYGAKTIVFARFVPIVRTFVPAVAGAARMEYRTFVTFNGVRRHFVGIEHHTPRVRTRKCDSTNRGIFAPCDRDCCRTFDFAVSI